MYSVILCLWIEIINSFTFKVIIDRCEKKWYKTDHKKTRVYNMRTQTGGQSFALFVLSWNCKGIISGIIFQEYFRFHSYMKYNFIAKYDGEFVVIQNSYMSNCKVHDSSLYHFCPLPWTFINFFESTKKFFCF